jgi:hypothetical protein
MLLLPEPFGPTITLTPGENSRLTRSGNDLNPFIVIDLRYMPKAPSWNFQVLSHLGRNRHCGTPHFAA